VNSCAPRVSSSWSTGDTRGVNLLRSTRTAAVVISYLTLILLLPYFCNKWCKREGTNKKNMMDIVDLWRAHFENSFKFHGSHHELVDHYKIFISNLVVGLFPFTKSFSSLHNRKDSYRTWLYELHGGLLIRKNNCLPFTRTWVHPCCLRGVLLIRNNNGLPFTRTWVHPCCLRGVRFVPYVVYVCELSILD